MVPLTQTICRIDKVSYHPSDRRDCVLMLQACHLIILYCKFNINAKFKRRLKIRHLEHDCVFSALCVAVLKLLNTSLTIKLLVDQRMKFPGL